MTEKFYVSQSKSGEICFDTNLTDFKDFETLSQTISSILISEMIGRQSEVLKYIFMDLCMLLSSNGKPISECISNTNIHAKYNFTSGKEDLDKDTVAEILIEWDKEDNLDVKRFSLKCLAGSDLFVMMIKFLKEIKSEDYITFVGDNSQFYDVKFVTLFQFCLEQAIQSVNKYRDHVESKN